MPACPTPEVFFLLAAPARPTLRPHRASTVLLADRVALMSGGTVAHVGTHAELLATVPEYRDPLSAEYADRDRLLEVAS